MSYIPPPLLNIVYIMKNAGSECMFDENWKYIFVVI
jgi:hypothetical protein